MRVLNLLEGVGSEWPPSPDHLISDWGWCSWWEGREGPSGGGACILIARAVPGLCPGWGGVVDSESVGPTKGKVPGHGVERGQKHPEDDLLSATCRVRDFGFPGGLRQTAQTLEVRAGQEWGGLDAPWVCVGTASWRRGRWGLNSDVGEGDNAPG